MKKILSYFLFIDVMIMGEKCSQPSALLPFLKSLL